MISLSLRHLMLVLVLFHCVVTLGYAAPAEGKKGKGKGGVPAGSVDTVAAAKPSEKNLTFKLTSPAVKDGEKLPVEFTGDGDSASPPLAWTGVPKGTQSMVLIMHHLDPEGKTKIYWLMYDINPQTRASPRMPPTSARWASAPFIIASSTHRRTPKVRAKRNTSSRSSPFPRSLT